MILSDPTLQLVCAVLVLLAPVGVVLGLGWPGRRRAVVALAGGAAGAVASWLADALAGPISDPSARILDASIAAATTAILASLSARRLGPVGGVVLAAAWSALVHQPVVGAVIGEFPSLLQSVVGAIDFAGVLATHVALGGSLLVVHLLPASAHGRLDDGAHAPSWGRSLLAAACVMVGGTAWIVGVERVVDAATGRLVTNALVGIAIATALWLLVERIGWARVTPAGAVAGAWAGWAAVGVGAPFLAPPALVAAAALGGAVGSVLSGAGARDAPGAAPRRSWTIGAIGATATGGVVTALLADGFGLAATGTLLLAAAEVGAVLAATVLAALGGLLCWLVARAASLVVEVVSGARGRSAAARAR